MSLLSSKFSRASALIVLYGILASSGCNLVKTDRQTAKLLKTEDTTQAELLKEVNRFAKVTSLHAKIDIKFEDNSFAVLGTKEVYRNAPGDLTVQRPGKIWLKVQIPLLNSDLAQMTSDGETFRLALIHGDADGNNKKFIKGTNGSDYSKLERKLDPTMLGDSKKAKDSVNAFKEIRPQHLTDAMLVRPTADTNVYTESTIFQVEEDHSLDKKSPVRSVMRGYYLLDEFAKQGDGDLKIARRFWFDRVGGIRLARQQLFDATGEIESDIIYGKQGNLADNPEYANLPLQVTVTRPREHYALTISYQTPETVMIGNVFPDAAFVLQNTWNLEEIDLDKKLREAANQPEPTADSKAINKFH